MFSCLYEVCVLAALRLVSHGKDGAMSLVATRRPSQKLTLSRRNYKFCQLSCPMGMSEPFSSPAHQNPVRRPNQNLDVSQNSITCILQEILPAILAPAASPPTRFDQSVPTLTWEIRYHVKLVRTNHNVVGETLEMNPLKTVLMVLRFWVLCVSSVGFHQPMKHFDHLKKPILLSKKEMRKFFGLDI